LIYGETNSGKTEVVRSFVNKRKTEGATDILFFRAPDKATEGRLYDKMLRALNAPYKSSETPATKKDAVYSLLESQVKLVVIDDFSNLIASSDSMKKLFLITFREMVTDLELAIAATGIDAAKEVLSFDDQMRNRFDFFEVPKWEYNETYLSLIKSFEHSYGFPKSSDLVRFSKFIHDKSGGYLGQTRNLLKKAALLAIEERSDRILKKHLGAVDMDEHDDQKTTSDS